MIRNSTRSGSVRNTCEINDNTTKAIKIKRTNKTNTLVDNSGNNSMYNNKK